MFSKSVTVLLEKSKKLKNVLKNLYGRTETDHFKVDGWINDQTFSWIIYYWRKYIF